MKSVVVNKIFAKVEIKVYYYFKWYISFQKKEMSMFCFSQSNNLKCSSKVIVQKSRIRHCYMKVKAKSTRIKGKQVIGLRAIKPEINRVWEAKKFICFWGNKLTMAIFSCILSKDNVNLKGLLRNKKRHIVHFCGRKCGFTLTWPDPSILMTRRK